MRVAALTILMFLEIYLFYKGFNDTEYDLYAYFFLIISIIIIIIQVIKSLINKRNYKKTIAVLFILFAPIAYKTMLSNKIARYKIDETTEFKGYYSEGFTTIEAIFKKDKTFLMEYSSFLGKERYEGKYRMNESTIELIYKNKKDDLLTSKYELIDSKLKPVKEQSGKTSSIEFYYSKQY